MDLIARVVQTSITKSKSTLRFHSVTFEVDWDPIAFINDQCYEQSPEEAIAKAITLTGIATEARAVEAAQYTKEMWPFSNDGVMRLVQAVVRGMVKRKPNSTTCKCLINEGDY